MLPSLEREGYLPLCDSCQWTEKETLYLDDEWNFQELELTWHLSLTVIGISIKLILIYPSHITIFSFYLYHLSFYMYILFQFLDFFFLGKKNSSLTWYSVEDILQVLIVFAVESLELDFALLFPERHILLRVLPVLVVLATSSEKDSESLYKRVKINRLINIFKVLFW